MDMMILGSALGKFSKVSKIKIRALAWSIRQYDPPPQKPIQNSYNIKRQPLDQALTSSLRVPAPGKGRGFVDFASLLCMPSSEMLRHGRVRVASYFAVV